MAEPAGVEKVTGVRMLALCGDSLLIEGIEASLQHCEGVEIVLLETARLDVVQLLDKLNPDILVFSLTPGQLSCVFNFLRTHTDVVLIGLDNDFDLVLFLPGECRTLTSVADLVQVIEARIQVKNRSQLRGKEGFI